MSALTASWTKIPGPELPRSSQSVCAINGKVYIFGGWVIYHQDGQRQFSDISSEIQARQPVENIVHVVDISTGEYQTIEAKGDAPPPRVGHTGVAIGEDIYVFGGVSTTSLSHYWKESDQYSEEERIWDPSKNSEQFTSSLHPIKHGPNSFLHLINTQ